MGHEPGGGEGGGSQDSNWGLVPIPVMIPGISQAA